MTMTPAPVADISGARVLAKARRLGDDRPHLAGRVDQGRLAGRPLPRRARRRPGRLQLVRVAARQPRGDDPRDLREHPAAQPAARRRRGRLHRNSSTGASRRRSTTRRRPTRPPACCSWSSPAGVRLRVPRATGQPRAPHCSGSGPSSPSRTSASTARTSSAWAWSRSSSQRGSRHPRSAWTAPRPSRSPGWRRSMTG